MIQIVCDKCGAAAQDIDLVKFPLDSDYECRYRHLCTHCLARCFCWLVKNSKLEYDDIGRMLQEFVPEK